MVAINWRLDGEAFIVIAGRWPEICGHTFLAPPLRTSDFRANGLVVDLGGSTAAFSRAVGELFGGSAHVVEASAENFNRIEATDRLHRHHHAIAGKEGPVEFWLAEDDFNWGSTQQPGDFDYARSEEVEGITLTGLLEKIGADKVDLLKVDIEGAEFDMFQSTDDDRLRTISQITIEFHDFMDAKYIEPVKAVKHRLSSLGFIGFTFTRRFNGDVVFINRAHIDLGWWRHIEGKYLTKYALRLTLTFS